MRLTIKGGLQSRAANNRVNTVRSSIKVLEAAALFQQLWNTLYFSEKRDASYDGSAMWPDCSRNISNSNTAGYICWKANQRSIKYWIVWLQLRTGLVLSLCGASGVVTGCWQPWGIHTWNQKQKIHYDNDTTVKSTNVVLDFSCTNPNMNTEW